MYLYCIASIMACFVKFAQGMEPTPAVVEWLVLARQAQKSTDSSFNKLPKEIQGFIFAQIHPRQTVDEWMQNDPLCVQKFTVPGIIYSFNVLDDHCAYLSKQKEGDTNYAVNYLNLVNGSHRQCCTTYAGRPGARTPDIALCGDKIVYEDYQRSLFITDFKGKSLQWLQKAASPFAHSVITKTYQCHSNLPLVALVDIRGVLWVHNVNDCTIVDGFYNKNNSFTHECSLQWHPTLPILAIAHNRSLIIIDSIKKTCLPFENCFGWPQFSFDGNQVFMGNDEKLMRINYSQVFTSRVGTGKNFSDVIIRSKGDSVLLLENKKNSFDSGHKTIRLRSLYTDEETVLGKFNTSKGIYRLPRNHDYRLITTEREEVNGDTANVNQKTTISVFVPRSQACLQNYIMFQAGLAAFEAQNSVDWQLFRLKKYETLVSETAQCYSFFAQFKKGWIDCS
jgi:hypothetical protein